MHKDFPLKQLIKLFLTGIFLIVIPSQVFAENMPSDSLPAIFQLLFSNNIATSSKTAAFPGASGGGAGAIGGRGGVVTILSFDIFDSEQATMLTMLIIYLLQTTPMTSLSTIAPQAESQ